MPLKLKLTTVSNDYATARSFSFAHAPNAQARSCFSTLLARFHDMFDHGVILLAQFSVGDYRFFDILLVHHELGFTAPEMYSCLEDFPKSTNCFLAHSREFSGALSRRLAFYGMRNYKILTLHLCDGNRCEVNLPPDDLHKFTDWLREQNLSARWDAFRS